MNAWSGLEFFGGRVFHATWQATCLIGVVLVLQRLLRHRLSPKWRHALWFPVLLRLALPFTPPATFSLFRWVPLGAPAFAETKSPSVNPPPRHNSSDLAPRASDPNPLPWGTPPDAAPSPPTDPAATMANRPKPGRGDPTSAVATVTPTASGNGDDGKAVMSSSETTATSAPPTTRVGPPLAWKRVLAAVWFLGALGFLSVWLTGLIRLRARLRTWPRVEDPGVLRLWKECHALMGVGGDVRLVESREASGPALFGLGSLWLLLPPGFASRFSPAQQRHIFLHELAHLRRHDIAVHWIMALLQAIHWFNPLVWLAFARLRAVREEAADALALAAGSPDAIRDYGFTVLQLVEEASQTTRLPGWVGILDAPGQLKERIESIARFQPGSPVSRWPMVLPLVLAFIGLTDAPRSAPAANQPSIPDVPAATAPSASTTEARFQWTVVTNGPAVRVKVRDAVTGKPLEGAEVVTPSLSGIRGMDLPEASRWLTDASGEVTIHLGAPPELLTPQERWFTIAVRREGFASRGRSWLIPPGVAPERVPATAEFRLQRGQTVGGVMRDEAGLPLPGVRVRLFASGYQYGPPGERDYPEFWQSPDTQTPTTTDEKGRWEVSDFPIDLDQVRIECRRPDGMVHRFEGRKREVSSVPIPEPEWGAPLDLEAFHAKEAALVLPTGFVVRGRVLDPDGKPVSGARVRTAFGHPAPTRAGETRSDASGRFEFRHRTPIEWILTAEAPGFAISSTVVTAGEAMPETEIRLDPLSPLRLKVTDPAGTPIAGARVSADTQNSGPQILDYSGTSDSEGNLVWTQAPAGPLAFTIQTEDAGRERFVKLARGERNREVRVRPSNATNIVVTGKCVEVGTGRPISVATIAFRGQYTAQFSTVELETVTNLGEGRFRLEIPLSWFYPRVTRTYQLRLWAPGVGRVTTEPRDFDDGDWELTVPFRRGGAIQGIVRRPNGQPAWDAVVAVSQTPWRNIILSDRGIHERSDLLQSYTDVMGQYGIDDPGGDAVVLIRHQDGFLELEANQLRTNADVTLLPYGRIEGVLPDAQRTRQEGTVLLSRDSYGRFGMNWSLYQMAKTGPDGTFVLTNVPAGSYVLNRPFPSPEGPYLDSHPQLVRVESGATVRVTYGGDGRPVVGRVRGRDLHWQAVYHRLVAVPNPPQPRWPDPSRFASAESYQRFTKGYEAMNAWYAQNRGYGVMVARDGSFRAEDVPSGTYELELIPYDPRSPEDNWPPDAPRLRRAVIVPPVTDATRGIPLDLGVLEFPPETK